MLIVYIVASLISVISTLIFSILRILNAITWAWILVLSPLWGLWALLLIVSVIVGIKSYIYSKNKKARRSGQTVTN